MNFGGIIPKPNIMINRPKKISNTSNLYKIPISHTSLDGKTTNQYEIWTTREAVQQHFQGLTEEPKEYELKKFARQLYEKQLRSSKGPLQHKGILVTSDSVTHGNPLLWPNNISHPEVKL
ncbi:MAG TPA: hypothetical protein VND99_02780 [Candidatus Acidoferrales bacterium]|nr:hypothetical protein [Candidatus Acidoferrales bacterium]